MSELSVLVVDDEPLARGRILRLLRKIDWIGPVTEAGDVAEARQRLQAGAPDVLLLDIQMPGGSGFDLLADLGDRPPAVIFVTAFDHHAVEAFEANAVDYVTKPVEARRFLAAMERARRVVAGRAMEDRIDELQAAVATLKRSIGEKARRRADIWVKAKGDYVRIPPEAITRLQADRDYVLIYAHGEEYLCTESLTALEQRLGDSDFIRLHRSAIVQRAAIVRLRQAPFSALIAVLADGSEVRVGRTYGPAIRRSLLAPPR